MRVVDAKNLQSQPWDMPSAFAAVLINAGFIKEWHPPVDERGPQTTWGVETFLNDGRPYIIGNCATCKPKSLQHPQFTSTRRDPENVFFSHCHSHEPIPDHIITAYKEALASWVPPAPTSQRRVPQQPVRVSSF